MIDERKHSAPTDDLASDPLPGPTSDGARESEQDGESDNISASDMPAASVIADGNERPSEPVSELDDVTTAEGDQSEDPFDAPVRRQAGGNTDGADGDFADTDTDALIVNIDGYEGPLDVLLDLARRQKVDLRRISMIALVDQYLAFVEAAKAHNLELAADYLVMASWLAFLKSKILLPVADDTADEPSADAMAARLAFQLQRLEAMRKAADALLATPQSGRDFFTRGGGEGLRVERKADWRADLYDLLKAYARQRIDNLERNYAPPPPRVMQIEEARARLARILGASPEWISLGDAAIKCGDDAPPASVIASAFNAALEFAKDGRIDLRQVHHFEPIYLRPRETETALTPVSSALVAE
ncbi:MAG: segregation/condensation protein A [Pseudomonadota bacterium]